MTEKPIQEPATPDIPHVLPLSSPIAHAESSPNQFKLAHLLLGAGLGVAVTLAAVGLFKPAVRSPGSPAAQSTAAVTPAALTAVTLATVTAAPIQQTLAATGTVEAAEMLDVRAANGGLQIRQVLVEAGDVVTPGQVLAILDSTVLQAEIREASAQTQAAAAKLAELQSGSRTEEISRAEAGVRSAEAEIQRAESDLTLANQRMQRNQALAREGAIARDQLDELLNQARSAEASLSQAKAALQQSGQQLNELKAGPRAETLAQAEAELEANRQRVQSLQAQLEQTQVVAPRGGKIAERLARVGALASGKLFGIIDAQQLELHLELPETQLGQVRLQQGVWISRDTSGEKLPLIGRVQAINPLIDPKTRMATVKVSLTESAMLQPGMFLRGAIITGARRGLTIPTDTVLSQPDGSSRVYRLNADRTVSAQTIEVGELLPNQQVEVKKGLSETDRVILKGAAYLKDGDRVEVN